MVTQPVTASAHDVSAARELIARVPTGLFIDGEWTRPPPGARWTSSTPPRRR